MSTAARRRLMRDFRKLQNDPPSGVSGAPMDNNIMLWQAVIFGYNLIVPAQNYETILSLTYYRWWGCIFFVLY